MIISAFLLLRMYRTDAVAHRLRGGSQSRPVYDDAPPELVHSEPYDAQVSFSSCCMYRSDAVSECCGPLAADDLF